MSDTSVTAQSVIDNSLSRAKDSDKTQWADTELLKFLNKAYDYTQKLLIRIQSELVITTGTVTMSALAQEYTLDGDLDDFWAMAHHGVYFDGQGDFLVPVPYEDKVRSAGSTTDSAPSSYYLTSTKIGVLDIPTATSTAAYSTLSCRYFKKNSSLSLTTPMPYKNVFNEPMSAFMDNVAIVKTEEAKGEIYAALYNTLEETTLMIAASRNPI